MSPAPPRGLHPSALSGSGRAIHLPAADSGLGPLPLLRGPVQKPRSLGRRGRGGSCGRSVPLRRRCPAPAQPRTAGCPGSRRTRPHLWGRRPRAPRLRLPRPGTRTAPGRAQRRRRRRGPFKWRRGRAPKFAQVVERGRAELRVRPGHGAPRPLASPPWTTSPPSPARAAASCAAPPAGSGGLCPAASARFASRTSGAVGSRAPPSRRQVPAGKGPEAVGGGRGSGRSGAALGARVGFSLPPSLPGGGRAPRKRQQEGERVPSPAGRGPRAPWCPPASPSGGVPQPLLPPALGPRRGGSERWPGEEAAVEDKEGGRGRAGTWSRPAYGSRGAPPGRLPERRLHPEGVAPDTGVVTKKQLCCCCASS